MSWKDIDNPKKKKIDKNFVSCDERYDKEQDKFREYEVKYGKNAVDICCEKHNNRSRYEFEKCLEENKKCKY